MGREITSGGSNCGRSRGQPLFERGAPCPELHQAFACPDSVAPIRLSVAIPFRHERETLDGLSPQPTLGAGNCIFVPIMPGLIDSMLYHESQQWLFTHVSRTGGTSIRSALQLASPRTRAFLTQHANLADAKTRLGVKFEQTFCFAFVRNPWERLVSWYAMIGETLARTRGDLHYRNEPHNSHWSAFEHFLNRWSAELMMVDGRTQPRHSQWAQLSNADDRLLTQMLGRYENFAHDRQQIFAKLGVRFDHSAEALNDSSHLPYAVYYSRQSRELVARVFSDDVERFGYEFLAE